MVFLAILLFGILPAVVLYALVEAYGRRHNWESRRLWQWVVVVGVGWSAIFGRFVLDAPLSRVAVITALLLVVALLYVRGLQSWGEHFRRKRADPGRK